MSEPIFTSPSDSGAAWDELYDTSDGQPALPPSPESPRRRRVRRRLLVAFGVVLIGIGGAAIAGIQVVRSVSGLLAAIADGDTGALQRRVNWMDFQHNLRGQLNQMARHVEATTPGAADSSRAYLQRLIDVTVAAQARPDLLARTIRGRVFSGNRFAGRSGQSSMLNEIGPVHLPGWAMVQLDFPGGLGVFPAGVSLCLRLDGSTVFDLRLSGLAWPEFTPRC